MNDFLVHDERMHENEYEFHTTKVFMKNINKINKNEIRQRVLTTTKSFFSDLVCMSDETYAKVCGEDLLSKNNNNSNSNQKQQQQQQQEYEYPSDCCEF